MATIWLGDFRFKQLQQLNQKNEGADDIYFVDEAAEYSWLANTATAQLPKLYSSKADIIIALGFNDCVYSCAWKTFGINSIADKYIIAINNLMELYTESNFYVCAVGPVDDDYPFAQYETSGIIPKKILNDKIKAFNKQIKATCKADFIDCYEYLINTSFETRDGVRYTANTCTSLQDYIRSQIKEVVNSFPLLGRVRDTENDAPKVSDPDFAYWRHTSKSGGLNECVEPIPGTGNTLPNCVGYAWGRFYEIMGERPKLSKGDAGTWYTDDADGYERSKKIDEIPKVGAVICWSRPGAAGHVGIVESVDSKTGVIKTSESGYEEKTYDPTDDFWVTTRVYDSTKKNWRLASNDGKNTPISSWIDNYVFQGFIYPPYSVASKDSLCTENSYGITKEEMKPNVRYIWQYFGTRGWTLNAVAGLLGNLQQESKMSPAVWENVIDGSGKLNSDGTRSINTSAINNYYNNYGRNPGFGLVQWTPYSKFTNWCKDRKIDFLDIDSQLQRIEYEAINKIQWIKKPSKGYDLTFNDFITSDKDAAWLAGAFAFCYERPARSTGTAAEQEALRKERGDNATYWFDYLKNLSPIAAEESVFKASNFKIDKYEAKKVCFSFFARNWASGEYILSSGKTKITSKKLSNTQDELNCITINHNKILPNKTYKLKLIIQGDKDESFTKELTFKIPQSYPEPIKKISLTCNDKLKDFDSTYTFKITKPDNLGYWNKNLSGYEIQLFINSKCVKTKTINDVQNLNSTSLTIQKEFNYKPKTGDIIQIGVRVWVTDDDGNKVFSGETAVVSSAICLLNKLISTHLNIN